MEKSHHHSQNADDFSINSVYLETFRKRKMKKKLMFKAALEPDLFVKILFNLQK